MKNYMVVWIKEYLDLTKETVRIWFKKNIELRHFDGTDYVKRDDIIVVSSNDKDVDKDLHNLYNVIVYEETIGIISNQIINYVNEYFDYYYIKNSIRQTKERTINTIVTGSSYGRVGVDEKSMLNAINLSLSSQDIYYSLKGIEKACEFNSTIKNIVVCCGYYYFYSDLSKSKNIPELYKIPNVYVPLFGNNAYHNCNILARKMGG